MFRLLQGHHQGGSQDTQPSQYSKFCQNTILVIKMIKSFLDIYQLTQFITTTNNISLYLPLPADIQQVCLSVYHCEQLQAAQTVSLCLPCCSSPFVYFCAFVYTLYRSIYECVAEIAVTNDHLLLIVQFGRSGRCMEYRLHYILSIFWTIN
jgi:hypothetical protein